MNDVTTLIADLIARVAHTAAVAVGQLGRRQHRRLALARRLCLQPGILQQPQHPCMTTLLNHTYQPYYTRTKNYSSPKNVSRLCRH